MYTSVLRVVATNGFNKALDTGLLKPFVATLDNPE